MADYEEYEPEDEGYERESPEVYRRRRIVAIIVAIVVIILLIWGVTAIVKKISSTMGGNDAGASTSAADNFDSFSARPDPSSSGSFGADTASPSDSSSAQSSDAAAQPAPSASSETPTAMAEGAKPAETPAAKPTTEKAVQTCSDSLRVTATANQGSYGAGQNPQITAHMVNASQNPCTVDLGAQDTNYTITSGPANVFSSATCGSVQGGQLTLEPGKEQTTSLTWDRSVNVYGCGAAAQQARRGVYNVTATVNGVSSQPVRIIIQ